MQTYRAFIGLWDDGPEVTVFDRDGLSWDEARAIISERLAGFRGYDCDVCEAQAAEEFARLQVAESGNFDANVEGDDYKIIRQGTLLHTGDEVAQQPKDQDNR